jgi:hypothetical protein
MREYFEEQFNNNRRATRESLEIAKNKNFHSGRKIEVNDLVLFAILNEKPGNLTLISLHEDELENYEPVLRDGNPNVKNSIFPLVKLKQI